MGIKHQETQLITQAPSALPPLIAIAFGAASVVLNGTTTLVFTITNPNVDVGLTGIAFTDDLPAGIIVGPVPGVINACTGGTVTAVAGSSQISYFGGTLLAGASCTITVTVEGTALGFHDDQVESITSREGGPGLPSNIATLEVTPVLIGPAALILNSLSIIDLTNPNAPVVASTTVAIPSGGAPAVSGAVECVDTVNHLYYVFGGLGPDVGNMLQSIDISDRTAPVILDTVPCTRPDADYVAGLTDDKQTLVAFNTGTSLSAAPNTIQVFDVSDPTNVTAITTYNLATDFPIPQTDVGSIVVKGTLAYALTSVGTSLPSGLVQLGIYDFSNPLAVSQLSVTTIRTTADLDTAGFLSDVISASGSLYAIMWIQENGAGDQRIECWDVTVPGSPTFAGQTTLLATAIRTNRWSQVAGGHLFGASISATQPNIFAVNVSNPTAPTIDGSTVGTDQRSGFSVRAAVVSGVRYCYVCQTLTSSSFSRTLQIYDASTPGALVALGRVIYRVGGSNQQLHLDA